MPRHDVSDDEIDDESTTEQEFATIASSAPLRGRPSRRRKLAANWCSVSAMFACNEPCCD